MNNRIVAAVSLYRIAGFVFFFLVFLARMGIASVPNWAIGIAALLAGIGLILGF
jgi:hypothetical protein